MRLQNFIEMTNYISNALQSKENLIIYAPAFLNWPTMNM